MKNSFKKIVAILSMIGVLNANATWIPQFQYGISPCMLSIIIYDSSSNILYSVSPATPPYPILTCSTGNSPHHVVFNISGGPNFSVDVDSSRTVSLPCLGGANHTFTVSMSPGGGSCDTTYYINY